MSFSLPHSTLCHSQYVFREFFHSSLQPASDLGYRGPGTISHHHAELLPFRQRSDSGVWHYETRDIPQREPLVRGCITICRAGSFTGSCWYARELFSYNLFSWKSLCVETVASRTGQKCASNKKPHVEFAPSDSPRERPCFNSDALPCVRFLHSAHWNSFSWRTRVVLILCRM